MILSLSGRKHSGKTTFAKEAIKKGFIKISFADKLKEITAKILNCSVEDLSDPELKEKKLEKAITWIEIKPKLEKILNITISEEIENKTLENRREVLQFIGTEALRTIDPEFHVNSLKEKILPNENYVLDDTRFLNELEYLNKLNATCIFTIRPYYQDYSNHISEIELSRKHFERVIVNSLSKEKMIEYFLRFLETNKIDLKNNVSSRNGRPLSEFFLSETPESCYTCGLIYAVSKKVFKNKCLLVELHTTSKINMPEDLLSIYEGVKTIDNQIYIDDFKRWDILQENKNIHNYPNILKGKEELQEHWFAGIKQGMSTRTVS
jgi:hypothetical protein